MRSSWKSWTSEQRGAAAIWRFVLTFVATVAIAYALVVAYVYVSQRSILYPGAGKRQTELDLPPPWGERIEIGTSDGERLEALLSAPASDRPTVLFFHGNASSVNDFGFLAEALAMRGLGLLAVSYRGYGGSTGSPSESGLILDGQAAFDWLAERHNGPIVVAGQSLGSAVAVAVAAGRQAAGILLISSPDSIAATARYHYPYLPVGVLIRDPFRSDLRIGNISAPKLFLHGDLDKLIPLARGRALFDQAPGPKEFRVLEGYGHNDMWNADLARMVADFVDASAQGARQE